MMIRFKRKEIISIKEGRLRVKKFLINLGFNYKFLGTKYLSYVITCILINPDFIKRPRRDILEPLTPVCNNSVIIMNKDIRWAIQKLETFDKIKEIATFEFGNKLQYRNFLYIVYNYLTLNDFYNVFFEIPEDGDIFKAVVPIMYQQKNKQCL